MNQHSNNPQYNQGLSSKKSHLTRTPLQSKINKNISEEFPNSKQREKTPEIFKQKSLQILSQLKPLSIEPIKTDNTTDDVTETDYNKEKNCSSSNCVHMHSPKRKLQLDLLTPPNSLSPIYNYNECNIAISPLKIKQLNYITSGDIELIKEYDTFINEPIDYEF